MRRPKAFTILIVVCILAPYFFDGEKETGNNEDKIRKKVWVPKYKGKEPKEVIVAEGEDDPYFLEQVFLPMKNISKFDAEQEKRRKKIREVCHKFEHTKEFNRKVFSGFPKSAFHMFTVDVEQRLVWCRVGKTGTSTWASVMLQLMNGSKDKGITNGNHSSRE